MNRTMDEMNEILRLKKLVKNSEVIPQGWFFISFFHFTESQITEFYSPGKSVSVVETEAFASALSTARISAWEVYFDSCG